jgi:DMSO reductase anchor subunit
MVYHDTRRKFWRWPAATEKFLGTTVILGSALLNLPTILATTAALKLFIELSYSARSWSAACDCRFGFSDSREHQRTRHLLTHDLKLHYILQLTTLALAAAFSFTSPLIVFAVCLLSELLERQLFFLAVSPDRMPGVPS